MDSDCCIASRTVIAIEVQESSWEYYHLGVMIGEVTNYLIVAVINLVGHSKSELVTVDLVTQPCI